MSKKKRTDREEELLIAGINARMGELRTQVAVAANNGSSDEKFTETLSVLLTELQELIKMKEDLT